MSDLNGSNAAARDRELYTTLGSCQMPHHIELSMSRALQGYATDATDATTLVSRIISYNVAVSMQQHSILCGSKQIDQDRVGHLEDKAKKVFRHAPPYFWHSSFDAFPSIITRFSFPSPPELVRTQADSLH